MPELDEEFCHEAIRYENEDWFANPRVGDWGTRRRISRMLQDIWQYPEEESSVCVAESEQTIEERFRKLADEWARETSTISSVDALVSHPKYQDIIRLGWDVVPVLLRDLQNNGDFWFPALAEITGLRPFDRRDAGKSIKMTAAWISWGKKRGII
jgi:PAS domain-containing protein